jgi:hypothetical protein
MKKNNAVTIRIELKHVKPTVWRQVSVPLDFSLAELHDVIQIAMGWLDGHLHQYIHGRQCIGMPDEDTPEDMLDEHDVSVGEIFTAKNAKLTYEYDFGDGWEHLLTSQGLTYREDNRPVILKGKYACPPEDCGGPFGYQRLREVIADPNHAEHAEMIEWLGGSFDPMRFDLEEANAVLVEATDGYGAAAELEDHELDVFQGEYDAAQRPDPQQWLARDEQERILQIESFHRTLEDELPNPTMHAAIHAVVENQLAEGIAEVSNTLNRLLGQGLDRHDAIHAVGSVLAKHMFQLIGEKDATNKDPNAAYYQDLKKLTAEKWLRTGR